MYELYSCTKLHKKYQNIQTSLNANDFCIPMLSHYMVEGFAPYNGNYNGINATCDKIKKHVCF